MIINTKIRYFFLAILGVISGYTAHAQSWNVIGTAGFSLGAATYISLAIDNSGTPYIAYSDFAYGSAPVGMKYNGSHWVAIGPEPWLSGVTATYMSIAVDQGSTPYIAYTEAIWGTVNTLEYGSGHWNTIGAAATDTTGARDLNIVTGMDGTPYLAFSDQRYHYRASVMKYTGSAWGSVGTRGFSDSDAEFTTMAIDKNGTPYAAYKDISNDTKATVMKFDGSNWVAVGNKGFSNGEVNNIKIALDTAGAPYVAYIDVSNNNKATVMRYDGSNWVNVGSPGFSDSSVTNTCIGIDRSNKVYIAYADAANNGKATVMKYTGSAWTPVGDTGVSAGKADYISLVVNQYGTLYIAYEDGANNNNATVMYYGWPQKVENIPSEPLSFTLFPNPNDGSFTLNLPTQYISLGQKAQVVITNILGEKVKELITITNQETQIQLDTPPGIYFITVTTKDGTAAQKMIIK